MKKAIITGATSLIGISLVDDLLKNGYEVVGIVRPDSKRLHRLTAHRNLHIVECDLHDIPILSDSLAHDFNTFFHLAWTDTGKGRNKDVYGQLENVRLTLDALDLSAKLGCSIFVGAGSQAEFGPKETGPIGPLSIENPNTAYGICKLAAGNLAMLRAKELGLCCIWPRIFSIFGHNDKDLSLLNYTLRSLHEGERPSLTASTQIWDYLYCSDAAKALRLIGEKGIYGKKYCLGSGRGRPLYEYINEVKELVDPTAEIGFGEVPYNEYSLTYLVADTTELIQDTGFVPDYTFKAGLKEMIAHLTEKRDS